MRSKTKKPVKDKFASTLVPGRNLLSEKFVLGTELFKGCQKAWLEFSDSDVDCSWGNNNRTLVDTFTIRSVLEEDDHPKLFARLDVLDELTKLGNGIIYIDLEN